jgi:hypothetical protein
LLNSALVNAVVNGALSGLVATVPMTLGMLAMHRRLPLRERYPLPPREVTVRLANRTGARLHLRTDSERSAASYVAHFAFGTAAGAAFGPVGARIGHPVAAGIFYGLGVWAGAYLGVLPGLELRKTAMRQPPRREELMIAAHVVWGGVLGLLTGCLSDGAQNPRR